MNDSEPPPRASASVIPPCDIFRPVLQGIYFPTAVLGSAKSFPPYMTLNVEPLGTGFEYASLYPLEEEYGTVPGSR